LHPTLSKARAAKGYKRRKRDTSAYRAWKAKAQHSVDNAHMRYFFVHLHRLLDPGDERGAPAS
jgi:hypothetical protein